MYNPLQNTKRLAFHILLQVQHFFSCFLYHYLHFERFFRETYLNKLVTDRLIRRARQLDLLKCVFVDL